MIDYVLAASASLGAATTTVVVGHQADAVRAALGSRADLRFVLQEPQLGTAHAVRQAAPVLAGLAGTLVVLSGDVPLLSPDTLAALVARHEEARAAATLLTAVVDDPTGYGRVLRDGDQVAAIVEHRDASPAERAVREINAGIYAFDLGPLFPALEEIASNNSQQEYYLPDLVGIYRRAGRRVVAMAVGRPEEVQGINTRAELAAMSSRVWQKRREALMASGVTLEDPATTYVDAGVIVGPDSVIHPGVHLLGGTRIGARAVIHGGVRIVDSELADDVRVLDHCVIVGARIANGASVGPFAHLRPESDLGAGAKVGNFVELKKTDRKSVV
jgi:bifunctional UDP-N-acetylglucosamine pyrophosphorylase/glucosamine-1-phosphate N-acetyltransferase